MGIPYFGVNNTAKEIPKLYLGNGDGLARAISRGYIGDENGIARMIYGGGSIPSYYTPIEYLESDGTNYLNTGVIPHVGKTKMELKAALSQTYTDSNARYIAGTRNSSQGYFAIYDSQTHNYALRIDGAYGYAVTGTGVHTCVLDSVTGNVSLDGVAHSVTNTTLLDLPIYLYAVNNNNEPKQHIKAKIYYCKIWEEGHLIRDLVPVQHSLYGYKGLYDRVEQKLYGLVPMYLIEKGEFTSNSFKSTTGTISTDTKSSSLTYREIMLRLANYNAVSNRYYVVTRHVPEYFTQISVKHKYTNTNSSLFYITQCKDWDAATRETVNIFTRTTSVSDHDITETATLADRLVYPDLFLQLIGGRYTSSHSGTAAESCTLRLWDLWME